ncbi:MAG: glycerate kinase [Saprospiraceae bacterium]|nr:glycerate kinase [Saprospiraceae bacterium]
MKILIIPDSFKGSATNVEVANSISQGVLKIIPAAQCQLMPLADGGEGSLETIRQSIGGQLMFVKSVQDPLGRLVEGSYLQINDTSFVELAQVSGLQLLSQTERSVGKTSTLGTGTVIAVAAQTSGEIVLCIGGSATNDAGCGIAHALGYRFKDEKGHEFLPVGDTLINIVEIVAPERLSIRMRVLCDVKNPFYRPSRSHFYLWATKGASTKDLERIEKGMLHFKALVKKWKSTDLDEIPGAGAAGGVGGGMVAFFNATLESGIHYFINKLQIENAIRDCDLVFTGEGRIDYQTKHGKLISGITTLAQKHRKPVIALCGALNLSTEEIFSLGLTAAFSILSQISTEEDAYRNAPRLISETTSQIIRVINWADYG